MNPERVAGRPTYVESRSENPWTQNEFLGMLAHDLRAPLHNLAGFFTLLEVTSLNSHQRECLSAAIECVGDLERRLSDILDSVRLDSSHLGLRLEPTDLREVIHISVKNSLLEAEMKKLDLALKIAPNVPDFLEIDRTKVSQILSNLISNAIKFTVAGTIKVGARYHAPSLAQETIEIIVSDTGIGIPSDRLPHIFTAWYRGDTGLHGSGLGLCIVKKLTDAMAGQIAVQSSPGLGTTFSVRIPIRKI